MTSQTQSLGEGDFVELSYTARIADTGRVIDTTDPEVAERAAVADLTATGPVVVVLGEEQLFDEVERAIEAVGVGASGEVRVDTAEAFGDADPTAVEVVDVASLPEDRREQGAWVELEGESGFVESIDDERATVNFNHPLTGTDLEYEFTVRARVTDREAKCEGVLSLYELADAVTARVDSTGESDVVTLDAENPTETVEEWPARKRDAVATLRDHLDVEEIRVVERYPARDG